MGFFDGGTKGASFDAEAGYIVGTAYSGVITNVRDEIPLTDFNDKSKVKTYNDGVTPIMQVPIEFQCDQVQPVEGDDGVRVVYFEGGKRKAMRDALRAAGVRRDPRPGDWFSIQWVSGRGKSGDPKVFAVQFVPDHLPQSQFFTAQPAAAAAPAAPVAPAAPQPVPTPPVAVQPPAPVAPAPQPQAAQVAAALQVPPQVAPAQPAAPVAPPAPVAPAAPAQPEPPRPPWQSAPAAAPAPPVPVGAPAAGGEQSVW